MVLTMSSFITKKGHSYYLLLTKSSKCVNLLYFDFIDSTYLPLQLNYIEHTEQKYLME